MSTYGIDTSVLVRLVIGRPAAEFQAARTRLLGLHSISNIPIVVSSLVIAETYAVLQHHYGFTKTASSAALRLVFTSGLLEPLDGGEVMMAISSSTEPGLADRLIALDYQKHGRHVLTFDRKMARLSGCEKL
jgi:predicted nucleic acid-binding protein